MLKTVIVIQHETGENAGFFETVCKELEVDLRTCRMYETSEIPVIDNALLIVLGGSMSVHDEREYPFLRNEKILIRHCISRGLPVLGVCLGAQLIAEAMGGKVYPCQKEIGWTTLSSEFSSLFPARFHAFQLHGETFDIPPAGRRLCTGDQVTNQAFAIGSAIGVQFHVEMTVTLIEDWIRDYTPDLKEMIGEDTGRYLVSSNRICRTLMETLLG